MPAELPHRRRLPHDVPAWVDTGSTYFITVCCVPRGSDQLCHDNVGAVVFESVKFRQARGDWHMHLLLLMPDHLHALIAFPVAGSLRKTITAWKSLLARTAKITWQRDFFDHRLRAGEALDLKAAYIRENPVRAGLVANAADWRYVCQPACGGPGRSALP
jgi:putative transposase